MTSFEVWRRLERHQTCRPFSGRGVEGLGRCLLLAALVLGLAGGLLTLAGMGVYKGLSHSALFQVTGIKIEGCRRTTKEMILELSGIDIHTNLLAIDPKAVKARIETNEWVEQARVEREWPNQLAITIRERTPVALISLADGLYHVDRLGTVFARVVPPEDLDFPVITGLRGAEPQEEKQAAVQEALQFIQRAGRGNPVLPKQNISELHVDKGNGLILYLVDRPFPIRLGAGDMGKKYGRLVQVLSSLYRSQTFADTAYIRLDYQADKVLVGTGNAG
ncbi:MAG: FtsQ-type POTRA domain-containing protein [Desulfobacteraceae bacterium]|nr:FtsQ-type POTRA domain-containing protein [Desulfobacteraceae bacterium]